MDINWEAELREIQALQTRFDSPGLPQMRREATLVEKHRAAFAALGVPRGLWLRFARCDYGPHDVARTTGADLNHLRSVGPSAVARMRQFIPYDSDPSEQVQQHALQQRLLKDFIQHVLDSLTPVAAARSS